jgi:hypothetical protein
MGKPKKIAYEIINPETNRLPYTLLEEVRDHHEDTYDARIALAWRKGLKADVDGKLVLGKCVKASDLQRELVSFDYVILLNEEVWNDADFTIEKKRALLDHEMCHAARAYDPDGEPKIDENHNPVWRIRKHDLEEFTCIVQRHGIWKRDLERFAEAIMQRQQSLPLHQEPVEAEPQMSIQIDNEEPIPVTMAQLKAVGRGARGRANA